MGSIDIIKPLSNVLSSAINKSHEHQEKNTLECRELNLGLLGEKQVCYLCAMQSPLVMNDFNCEWNLYLLSDILTSWIVFQLPACRRPTRFLPSSRRPCPSRRRRPTPCSWTGSGSDANPGPTSRRSAASASRPSPTRSTTSSKRWALTTSRFEKAFVWAFIETDPVLSRA